MKSKAFIALFAALVFAVSGSVLALAEGSGIKSAAPAAAESITVPELNEKVPENYGSGEVKDTSLAENAPVSENAPTTEEAPEIENTSEVEDDSAETSVVDEVPAEDTQEDRENAIIISDKISSETPIWFSDNRIDADNSSFALGSFADVSKYIGTSLYCPTYGTSYDKTPFVSYNTRYFVSPVDFSVSGSYNNIQINDFTGKFFFWIDLNRTEDIVITDDCIVYESNGNSFVISKYGYPKGNYIAKANIDGNYYSFLADTVDDAKAIIDSLIKL